MATTILIPGLLSDETVWQPLIARLKGPALTADLSTQNRIAAMARDCLALAPGPLRVAGHSMGARVAMEMARQAPGRIERLALVSTGAHPLAEGEAGRRAEIVAFAHEHGMEALAERWLPGMVHTPNRARADLMQALTAMVLRRDAELHARQIAALVHRPDAAAYLAQIACPTLLLVGREDQWSPVAQHEAMAAALPDARLEIIQDAGHFLPLEQPEAAAEALAAFLEG